MIDLGILGIEFLGAEQFFSCSSEIPIVKQLDDTEGKMRFGEGVIKVQRFFRVSPPLGKSFASRNHAHLA